MNAKVLILRNSSKLHTDGLDKNDLIKKPNSNINILNLMPEFFLSLASELVLFFIFLKVYFNKNNRNAFSGFDSFRFGNDTQSFTGRQKFLIRTQVAKMSCVKMGLLFSYLNFVFNSTGKEVAVQAALVDWLKCSGS